VGPGERIVRVGVVAALLLAFLDEEPFMIVAVVGGILGAALSACSFLPPSAPRLRLVVVVANHRAKKK
jgi:hypothetical protein